MPLLPHLQSLLDGHHADGAAALALDIMGWGVGIYIEGFAAYHGLPQDDAFLERAEQVCVEVLRRCSPRIVSSLRVPNPSRSALFGELIGTADEDPTSGYVFCLAYAELLKKALWLTFCNGQGSAPKETKAFRQHVEREWDLLKPHEDWYYGFWVWPRLSLADMGRYCSDKSANPRYRQEMASYVAYQATTVPVLAQQAREAQRALTMAFGPYLRQTARSIADRHRRRGEIAADVDLQALQEELFRKLVPAYRKAVSDFDVYWLAPHPILPLGTLQMAWEKHRPTENRRETLFPERHLSFARRLAKAIEHITLDQLSEAREKLPTVSYDEAEKEMSRSAEYRGQLAKEARDEERRLLRRISRGKSTKGMASRALRSRPATKLHMESQMVVIDGQPLECIDMRAAVAQLDRSLTTLRKYDHDGKIRFVRDDDGNRWLPVDEVHPAKVVLRRSGEWAKMLGVSKETARKRLNEIPAGTDPLVMEEMLLATKGDGRKRRRRRADHPT